jgi:hypothetical protein
MFYFPLNILNPLNTELNPIYHMLTLLTHHIFHVSRIGINCFLLVTESHCLLCGINPI